MLSGTSVGDDGFFFALTDADHAALRRMLTSESDWLLDYKIVADIWASTGKNKPEPNQKAKPFQKRRYFVGVLPAIPFVVVTE